MALVYAHNRVNHPRNVKNLGWLLDNWQLVESFSFAEPTNGSPIDDLILVAHLKDGGFYLTHFASLRVCLGWLKRPVFYGLKVRNYLTARTVSPATDARYWLAPEFEITNKRHEWPFDTDLTLEERQVPTGTLHYI